MTLKIRFLAATAMVVASLVSTAVIAQQMHYLGIAATNRETVFQSEVSGAGAAVGRTWQLASSRTVAASFFGQVSVGSINAAIQETAAKMDRERDVLFLVVSSHGYPRGGGVVLNSNGALRAGQLRAALDSAGIKNRVILISACYAGQFIGPLSGPNTAVITAANATNPSFGCTNSRSYTYFGDAFFNYGMAQRGRDLRSAFAMARGTVTQWELRDGFKPSQPQMSMGGGIVRTLAGVK
jgi:Peptidase C13 family